MRGLFTNNKKKLELGSSGKGKKGLKGKILNKTF